MMAARIFGVLMRPPLFLLAMLPPMPSAPPLTPARSWYTTERNPLDLLCEDCHADEAKAGEYASDTFIELTREQVNARWTEQGADWLDCDGECGAFIEPGDGPRKRCSCNRLDCAVCGHR